MRKVSIKIKDKECWYGGAVNDGYIFPLDKNSTYKINLSANETYNQINPLYVSSLGRYIWLNKAGEISFEKGEIVITAEEIELDESSSTLKEAQLKATAKHFPPDGQIPDEIAFRSPQVCSWIALDYGQNQEGILSYATNYIKAGYKPGIIILDDTWQKDYGVWEFERENFPDPKGMIAELHRLGFKVVLWVVPYVSPDSPTYRELRCKDAFIRDKNGNYMLSEWWNGCSFVLDLQKPIAREWFLAQYKRLREEYDIDGLKLDGGDAMFLDRDYELANEQNKLYAELLDGQEGIRELRACYKSAGRAYIQRLADKSHRWGVDFIDDEQLPDKGYLKYGLSCLIPNILTLGLTGYYYGCPDMVGGGLAFDFMGKELDEELLVRSCQCSTLMPMIQFSYPYWESKSALLQDTMKSCLTLREGLTEYIVELAKNAAKTGEPIVRYMEYEFPRADMEKRTSQFMLGSKYLVAPVLEKGATEKTVYFPQDTKWRNLLTGERYLGATAKIPVDMQSILVFEKI